MYYRVVCVDELYNVDGVLCGREEELNQTKTTLRWPKVDVPKSWKKWWWEEVEKRLPGRKEILRWWYREPIGRLNGDMTSLIVEGVTYVVDQGSTRTRRYSRIVREGTRMEHRVP